MPVLIDGYRAGIAHNCSEIAYFLLLYAQPDPAYRPKIPDGNDYRIPVEE